MEIAKRFIDSLTKHAQNNFKILEEEKVKIRRATCDSCHYKHGLFCKECKCFLPEKTKWETEDCPICECGKNKAAHDGGHEFKSKWSVALDMI